MNTDQTQIQSLLTLDDFASWLPSEPCKRQIPMERTDSGYASVFSPISDVMETSFDGEASYSQAYSVGSGFESGADMQSPLSGMMDFTFSGEDTSGSQSYSTYDLCQTSYSQSSGSDYRSPVGTSYLSQSQSSHDGRWTDTAGDWTPRGGQASTTTSEYGGSASGGGPGTPTTSSSATAPKKQYQCLYPGCRQRPFGRSADLERHLQKIHFPESQTEKYNCDYKKCQRSASTSDGAGSSADGGGTGGGGGTAFTRRDHFRDHLREFHKEDILKRGRGSKDISSWWKERRVDSRWWRCGKCLNRVEIAAHEWECPDCRQMCERERQNLRNKAMKSGR